MKRLFPILLLLCGSLNAQTTNSLNENGKQIRSLSREKVMEANATPNAMQSLRIEQGKVWINGNLAQSSELPEKLQNVNGDFRFQASMYGVNELQFSFMGSDYLLKNGRIVELPDQMAQPTLTYDANTLTKQDYYNNLKQESPNLFLQINREALLTEKYMTLLMDYESAPKNLRPAIEEEIRLVLGELFDISIANMEMELRELEQEVDIIRDNIASRKANRSKIITDKLEEVTANK